MNHFLWQRIGEWARREPQQIAVRDGSSALSYGELWAMSGHLAQLLLARGIGRGDRVGMLLPKSVECVVTMLGVMRAGAAYVPIDPRAPAMRAAFVLRNAAVRAFVARPELASAIGVHRDGWNPEFAVLVGRGDVNWLDPMSTTRWGTTPPHPELQVPLNLHEGDPAYILYTSGSTGVPKGVVISHRNALTFVEWGLESFDIGAADILSNHAPFHFDLSVFDVYCALHAGATVCIVPDRLVPFPAQLASWIVDQEITIWYSVPSALTQMLKQGQLRQRDLSRVRTVLFAGEVFPLKYLRDVMPCFPNAGFHNLFGPTETNVCTWYTVPRPIPESMIDLPIGRGCANMDAIVLHDDGRPAIPGEEGELLIGGPGIMLGYWGQAEKTASVRIQNPLHSNFADPVHRTGDRVRILPDGTLQFAGRRDHMVKTRGYRVELGEIEAALHAHPAVRSAIVTALPDDEIGARLHAVIAAEDGIVADPVAISAFLLERIARYAVPESITVLPDLPVTSTGKADRSAIRELLRTARPLP